MSANRLRLSERVMDLQFAPLDTARAAWRKVAWEIPESKRKDDVESAVASRDRHAIRESAMRLYIWLEGFEAAQDLDEG